LPGLSRGAGAGAGVPPEPFPPPEPEPPGGGVPPVPSPSPGACVLPVPSPSPGAWGVVDGFSVVVPAGAGVVAAGLVAGVVAVSDALGPLPPQPARAKAITSASAAQTNGARIATTRWPEAAGRT
jgi:hypothetical protein